MAASSFEPCLAYVLRHEGGYSNHPADPGGPTNKGVIQRVYDAFRKGRSLAPRDVRVIEDAEVREIYRSQYWAAVSADALPPGVDYAVFDAAVNSGPAQAAKWLQRALKVPADGQIGAVTLAAARAADAVQLIEAVCDQREAMLRGLRTFPVFGRGWTRRVADVRRDARSLVSGHAAARTLAPGAPAPGRALPADLSLASIARMPEAMAALVAAVGTLANAASAPGPLQWAVAASVLVAVAAGALAFLRRQRAT